jgi:hypothetical protein
VDVDLERGDGGSRRLVAPERVYQPVARHDCVRVQKQQRKQGALLRGSQREQVPAFGGLDRSQDAELRAPLNPSPNRASSRN